VTVFKLKDTPAEKYYKGCGHGILVVRDKIPETVVYDGYELTPENQSTDGVQFYSGMVSCYEFVVERELNWLEQGYFSIS